MRSKVLDQQVGYHITTMLNKHKQTVYINSEEEIYADTNPKP